MSDKERRTQRRLGAAILATAASVAMVFGTVSAANAVAEGFSGSTVTGEYRYVHSVNHVHYATATVHANVSTLSPGPCGSSLGLALLSLGSGNGTNFTTWTGPADKYFYWNTGSNQIPGGTYVFVSHNRGGGNCGYSSINWSGTLYI